MDSKNCADNLLNTSTTGDREDGGCCRKKRLAAKTILNSVVGPSDDCRIMEPR